MGTGSKTKWMAMGPSTMNLEKLPMRGNGKTTNFMGGANYTTSIPIC